MLVGCRTPQLKRKVTGEKGPSTEPELVTYTLTRSFSHASYRSGHVPSSPIAPYVPVTGVPLTVTA